MAEHGKRIRHRLVHLRHNGNHRAAGAIEVPSRRVPSAQQRRQRSILIPRLLTKNSAKSWRLQGQLRPRLAHVWRARSAANRAYWRLLGGDLQRLRGCCGIG